MSLFRKIGRGVGNSLFYWKKIQNRCNARRSKTA
ncbi:unnamed protein product [Acanthoscelides obtectus]|uniref:Uncharacterized protein n=1 Tax=Acanthoscelides obtectus TaxID=200917 RepID=A0A9P0LRP8_ACAOB|nr:unnamed protein product [Acanthoscelides obtectus]CAK1653548.1 hypothetical protein AOBTE_LOCUS18286 [Acanthoscelides obtectus]